MVGPFLQGVVLMGIIFLYTKNILTVINDYYRGEFQRRLKEDGLKNETTYDIENIESLLRIDESASGPQTSKTQLPTSKTVRSSMPQLLEMEVCINPRDIKVFWSLIEEYSAQQQELDRSQLSFCWLSEGRGSEPWLRSSVDT